MLISAFKINRTYFLSRLIKGYECMFYCSLVYKFILGKNNYIDRYKYIHTYAGYIK